MISIRAPDFSDTPYIRSAGLRKTAAGDPPETALVSIVTPFHNTPIETFSETLNCVLVQTFRRWKWLIIDDGSAPEVAATLDSIVASLGDVRLQVVRLPSNLGLPAARNAGFSKAQTDFVVMLDADDLLEATAIEKWWWYLENYPGAAFVKGFVVSFGDQNYLAPRGFVEGDEFLNNNLVSCTAMIRRSAWATVGGFDEGRRGGLEDWDFWLRLANAQLWGGTIPEFHDWYRRRSRDINPWSELTPKGLDDFRRRARERFPRLFEQGGFPSVDYHCTGTKKLRKRTSATVEATAASTPGPTIGIAASEQGLKQLLESLGAKPDRDALEYVLLSSPGTSFAVGDESASVFRLATFSPRSAELEFWRYLVLDRRPFSIVFEPSGLAPLFAMMAKELVPQCEVNALGQKSCRLPRSVRDGLPPLQELLEEVLSLNDGSPREEYERGAVRMQRSIVENAGLELPPGVRRPLHAAGRTTLTESQRATICEFALLLSESRIGEWALSSRWVRAAGAKLLERVGGHIRRRSE